MRVFHVAVTLWGGALVPLFLALFASAGPAFPAAPVDCRLKFYDPVVDFEFRLFAAYEIRLPVKGLVGPRRRVAVETHVIPVDPPRPPARLGEEFLLGPVPDFAKGVAVIHDSFAVGPGRYRLEVRLRDPVGGDCEGSQEFSAKPRGDEVKLTLEPGEVEEARVRLLRSEASVTEPGRPALRLKLFLNLDPPVQQRRRQVRVDLADIFPRVAAMRALSRQPVFGELALVAFSLEEQRTLVEHGFRRGFVFPALRSALGEVEPGLVSIDQLAPGPTERFFQKMLSDQIEPGGADVYIFVGPDGEIGRTLASDFTRELRPERAEFFFLNTTPYPWRGLIGSTVRRLGGKEMLVPNPKNLAKAIAKVVDRVAPLARSSTPEPE